MFDVQFKIPRAAIQDAPIAIEPPSEGAPSPGPEPGDQFIQDKPNEYRWIVDVAGVAGALIGGVFFGVPGIIIGGTLLATASVPWRRFLTERENPQILENDLSLGGEVAVTAGSSLLFGALFMGAAGLARIAGIRLGAAIATRVASAAARRPIVQTTIKKGWEPFQEWYMGKGHALFRGAATAAVVYDVTHDKNGNPDISNLSIDTGWGFAASLYSGNLIYGKFFGTNPFGLDAAAPLSFAAYQLFRTLAGANPFDLSDMNYNEALRFRYIAEFGNILQSTATYGRAYLRPDLREAIAVRRGLTASKETGTEKVSPFGWLADNTLGVAYRHAVPRFVKTVVRPTIHYPVGPLFNPPRWSGRWGRNVAQRLTIIKDFKRGDMMKPEYGEAGRLVALGQTWGLVVPWWLVGAPAVGMSRGEWGPNRYWKFTAWSLVGTPIKSGLGGDTVAAQAAGFGIGMIQDAVITQFYNPRYKKRHWEEDLHTSLARFHAEPPQRDEIAAHIFDDIFCRQMTDWSLSEFVQGNGLHRFNGDYLETFATELAQMTPEEREIMQAVYENRLKAADAGRLSHRQKEGLTLLSDLLPRAGSPST